ncbi:MAG TPA: DinB family protein [Dehalococcoidia bacterium]|nr:DinB family protein [Dehalococcoidia bacterium]
MAEQEALIAKFRESQTEFVSAVSGLSDQRTSEAWSGTWGIKQIVAHISGWESTMTEALEKITRGERPTVEGIDLSDTDGSNATFTERAASTGFDEILDGLRSAGERLTAAIRAVPDDRIEEGRTARRIVETLIRHPGEHTSEILGWRRAHGV